MSRASRVVPRAHAMMPSLPRTDTMRLDPASWNNYTQVYSINYILALPRLALVARSSGM